MSIWNRNLDKFSSKVFVAPVDTYELEVLGFGLKMVEVKNEKVPVVGVRYVIKSGDTTGTEYAGKPVTHDVWLKKEEDLDQLFRIFMCAVGIKPGTDEADNEFRMRYGSEDFTVDTDSVVLGAGFNKAVKGIVRCQLSSNPSKTDSTRFFQNFKGYSPI